jgi:exopolysaccharide/PEP-CTERM locus tyrosine autokinase
VILGKISDALEKHKRERLIPLDEVRSERPVRVRAGNLERERAVRIKTEDPETRRAREIAGRNAFSESLVMLSSPDSSDAETFKLLRGQILFPRDREVPRSILVTSTFPGEGKTFTAANLAAAIAMSVDEYVLLIDADMRRARIHRMFGIRNERGLHDYLVGEHRFEDLIVKTAINKLSVLPAGRAPRNPAELLSSNLMAGFLEEAKHRYKDRFLIIDSPPTHITAEAKFLSQFVEGVVFVIMANKTPRKDAQKAVEDLGRDKVLGVVFNGYNQARKSYHKYYEKYYKRE